MEKKSSNLVPSQQTGTPIDTESFVELGNEEEARAFFETVKHRLRDVNNWDEISGDPSAKFQLVDKDGFEVKRSIQEGDYFKIDIPGPGTIGGRGYDWVRVEELENVSTAEGESLGFRVRPARNPKEQGDIVHFYSSESTSSFIVTREKNKIFASIYDRNIKPNKEAGAIVDKVRDIIVGAAGILAFSRIQWKKLADGLLAR